MNAFQNPAAVLADIDANVLAANQAAEKTAFLQRIHREIAIAKITAYLTRQTMVAVNLPDRTATTVVAASPAIVGADEYRTFVTLLRGAATAG